MSMRSRMASIAWASVCLCSAACLVRGSDDAVAAAWSEPAADRVVPAVDAAPAVGASRRDLTTTPHPEMVAIRSSLIPGAGEGLFAEVDIPDGTYIGFYRGDYVTPEESDAMQDTKEGEYLFFLPLCADDELHDSIAGDMNDYVSKVNYAPRTINRQPTHLQNVIFKNMCEEPYVRLYATRAIEAGEELYVDYGPDYDYAFMEIPTVQDYLLRVTGIAKEDAFTWEHSP
jgi:hypothetical protein